jgi:hypothetical protein
MFKFFIPDDSKSARRFQSSNAADAEVSDAPETADSKFQIGNSFLSPSQK